MKLNVAVIFGGQSTEHEISMISANQVINAIDSDKYDITPIYISKNKDLYIGDALFDIANYADIVKKPDELLKKVTIYKDGQRTYVKPIKGLFVSPIGIDVAFPVVHGTNVEDGCLAGLLEMMDIPYTSCGVIGAAVGQDKAIMKDILLANELPIIDYFVISNKDFIINRKDYVEAAKATGYPLIAKPSNLGSSIGIEIINNEDEFIPKVEECLKYDYKVVIEKKIEKLKEVNISVIGNMNEIKVSQIEDVSNDFLDYEKKYINGSKGSKGSKIVPLKGKLPQGSKGMASTLRKIPASLTKKQNEEIKSVAIRAYKCLDAFGCVRIDFMIDQKTNKVYINEINTIPGSLSFYLWEATGMSFKDECDNLINAALKRYADKQKKVYSFDVNILDGYRRQQ